MATKRRFPAHPQSAPGDFYVIHNECIACGAPHAVAPDLIGWSDSSQRHCVWKKQPETPEELAQAFAAFDASEVACYRYAGDDPAIIARLGPYYCDGVEPDASDQPMPVLPQSFIIGAGFAPSFDVSPPSLLSRLLAHCKAIFRG